MNFKKILNLGFVVGGISLFGNPITSHAIEYEKKWEIALEEVYDYPNDIVKTESNEMFFLGVGISQVDNYAVPTISKVSGTGELFWTDTLDDYYESSYNQVVATDDGGCLVVGSVKITNGAKRDGIIVKYSLDGVREWVKVWGGSGDDYFNGIVKQSDGGFVLVGNTSSTDIGISLSGKTQGLIMKVNQEGDDEWVKLWGGNKEDSFQDIELTPDGGYLIVGYSNSTDLAMASPSTSHSCLVVKFDSNWNEEGIDRIYYNGMMDSLTDIIGTQDGEYIVTGMNVPNYVYGIVARYNQQGERQWDFSLNDGVSTGCQIHSVTELPDGTLLLFTRKLGMVTLIQVNQQGNLVDKYSIDLSNLYDVRALGSDLNGNLFVGARIEGESGEKKTVLYKLSPRKDSDIQINGSVETMVADVTIPSVSPDLVINPNLPEGFVAPEFSVLNDSVSPIKLELKTFEQMTDTFNDVLPTKYESWVGLNKRQSQDIALGLIAKEGEGWQMLMTPTSYVANHIEHEIGVIKPASQVDFSFDVKHGTSFSEAKTVQYKMVFVFDLLS